MDALSNLVTVGTLNSGSISSGFGNIDNGTSNIKTGGKLRIDVDSSQTIDDNGGGINNAGSLTLGANSAAGLYVNSDNLYIENKESNKDIIFRVNDDGSFKTIATIDGSKALFDFESNKIGIGGTTIKCSADELNILDASETSAGTTTVQDDDGIVMQQNNATTLTKVQELADYLDDKITSMPNLQSISINPSNSAGGALNITNSTTQTSSNLVSITGNNTSTALKVSGKVELNGPKIIDSKSVIGSNDAPIISLNTYSTVLTVARSNVPLYAGTEGQIKVIVLENTVNVSVAVTNAAWGGNSELEFTTAGQACTLQYINSKWYVVGNNGVTIS